MREKISIIIPTYNVGAYIGKCLDSILAQTFTDYVVYVVDDCSTDNTIDILGSYSSTDARIKIVEKEINSGPSISRNMGISIAKGEYITFVDGDDCYLSNSALRDMLIAAEKNGADCVCCGYKTIHQIGCLTKSFSARCCGVKTAKEYAEDRVHSNFPGYHYIWNKLYRADLIRENDIRFTEGKNSAEDVEFNENFLCCMDSAVVLHKCFYGYNCLNENSLTRKMRGGTPPETEIARIFGIWKHIIIERNQRYSLYKKIQGTEKSYLYIDEIAYLYGMKLLFTVHDESIKQKLIEDDTWQAICGKIGKRATWLTLKLKSQHIWSTVKQNVKKMIKHRCNCK